MDFEEAQQVWEAMDDLEALALRRCASHQMEQEDLDEIGSSDVSCRAIEFIKNMGWPTDFGDIGIGFLVDEYYKDVENDPYLEPANTLARIQADGSYEHALPDWAYEGKHHLSTESHELFCGMQKMFHG